MSEDPLTTPFDQSDLQERIRCAASLVAGNLAALTQITLTGEDHVTPRVRRSHRFSQFCAAGLEPCFMPNGENINSDDVALGVAFLLTFLRDGVFKMSRQEFARFMRLVLAGTESSQMEDGKNEPHTEN